MKEKMTKYDEGKVRYDEANKKLEEKQREIDRAGMVRNAAQFGLNLFTWSKKKHLYISEMHKLEKEHKSEMHPKDSEHHEKMQEQDKAYQKEMQERDEAHDAKLFWSKVFDQWVSIVCKVCGILNLAYLLRFYLHLPPPAWAVTLPVPVPAWAIANP